MKALLHTSLLQTTVSALLIVGLAGLSPAATVLAQASEQMTDQSISDKIDDELLFDQGVVSTKIDVETSDGIVTLTGKVNNILAKERAARIAETVKGVRAVVNRVEVSPSPFRSDAQILTDVERALLEDPATESFEISTRVSDGIVTLTGSVDSHEESELVKTVTKGVRGVTDIVDRIDVDFESDRPDSEIENEIAESLRWNTYVDDGMIDVDVSDGQVVLSGIVGSAAEKRKAELEAWTAGVSAVDSSKLEVDKWARDDKLRGNKYVIKSESEIKNAIEAALTKDPRVSSFTVDVVGSTVTLRGEVNNLKAKRAAEQDVTNTVGVSTVENRMKVRMDDEAEWPTDAEIADKAREALLRDPFVERFDLTVTSVNGTLHLYGTVDSSYERNRATDVVSRVMGVVDVENHSVVDDSVPYVFDPYVDDYVSDDMISEYEPRAPTMSDVEIKESIESELWWSPFVDSDDITVSVEDGVATLTGTVDTWNEYQSATENAYQGDATLVDNNLIVNYDY